MKGSVTHKKRGWTEFQVDLVGYLLSLSYSFLTYNMQITPTTLQDY